MYRVVLFISLFIGFQLQAQFSYDDLHDQSNGIIEGYGSWGEYNVIQEEAIDVENKGTLTFYHPDIAMGQKPTVFFISGWGRPAFTYEKLFHFIASQGYAVINIYNTNPGYIVESYQNSLDMMLLAVNTHYTNWIDTSKVGLMGHSYGAGSTIWLGKEVFAPPHNWGTEGRFIFMTAPWYSLLVTEEDLVNYPEDVKLLIEINNDDVSNNPDYIWNTDERAIRGVFEMIAIPNEDKDFIRVYSDPTSYEFDSDNDGVQEIFTYNADHYISYSGASDNPTGSFHTWDALDVFAINRLSHALIDYVFEGDIDAKDIALGNGSDTQINMDFLTDLFVTDTPVISRPESEFVYKCSDNWNDSSTNENTWFLQNLCIDSDGDGIIDLLVLSAKEKFKTHFDLYPVPTSNLLNIRFRNAFEPIQEIVISSSTGKTITRIEKPNSYSINIENLETGTYFVKVKTYQNSSIRRFIVK